MFFYILHFGISLDLELGKATFPSPKECIQKWSLYIKTFWVRHGLESERRPWELGLLTTKMQCLLSLQPKRDK